VEGGWRQVVAHAATPWEWKTRGRVVALVVASVAYPVLFFIIGAVGQGLTVAQFVVQAMLQGTFVWFACLRPALRSLRRHST